MKALAYRIVREDNNEVILEGIVRDAEDSIYPAQEHSSLSEDFPELPYEVELRHFNVKGLTVETKSFQITWEEVCKLPKAKHWWS